MIFLSPEISDSTDQPSDILYIFLLLLLAIAGPIIILIFTIYKCFEDQIQRVCYVN
jgi:hypothetical protein